MPRSLVSLGSSYAAGPGISPVVDSTARRSESNYAHVLASQVDMELIDLSVSGATLSNILEIPQKVGRHAFDPQIKSVPHSADLILVLGGGNDIGYISRLFIDCFTSTWFTNAVWKLANMFGHLLPVYSDEEETVRRNYGRLLDSIHQRAPQAQILVVEYLTLIGPATTTRHLPISDEKLRFYKNLAQRLQNATSDAVKDRGGWCTQVPVASRSLDHGLGSTEPWLNGFSWSLFLKKGGGVLHPNALGMRNVAQLIQEHMV